MSESAELEANLPRPIDIAATFGSDTFGGSSRNRRSVRAGVLGAVLMFLGLAVLSGLAVKPFRPRDESAHVAYSIALAHGTIPRTYQSVKPRIPDQRPTSIHTANHPPLFYLLIAGPLVGGIAAGHPTAGLHVARLECAILSAITVALTASLAGMLAGRRKAAVQVTSAAVLGTLGAFIYSSSLVYNDALATMLSALVLMSTVAVLKRGLQPGLCALLLAAAASAITARASSAEVVALAGTGLIVAGVVHSGNPWRGAARGMAWAAATGLTCCASAGWFYLLNQHRYGNLTGRSQMQHNPKSLFGYLLSPNTYSQFAQDTYGDLSQVDTIFQWSQPLTSASLAGIWASVGIGTLWSIRNRSARAWLHRNPLVLALLALHCIACVFYVAWWVHTGGGAHTRYLFPALPVISLAVAAAVLGLPLGRIWAGLLISLQLVLSVVYLAKLPAQWTGHDDWTAYPSALHNAGVPIPGVISACLLLVVLAGWTLCINALWTSRDSSALSGPGITVAAGGAVEGDASEQW